MAFVLADRVKESCAAPGTGTVTLLGAATGYQSFSAGIGANNTTYYTIADQGGANWEVGYGTIGAGGTTLARTTVLASSNSGSLVNFSSGTQDVFCDYPATKAVNLDSSGNVSALGTVSSATWNATAIGLAYGGTGKTSAPAAMANLMGFTSTATAAGTTTLTNASSFYQLFTGSTSQTVVLPVTSTLQTGWTFHICNNSTSNLTVNSSGGNLVISVIAGTTVMVTCIGTTLTTAADWEAGYTDFSTLTGTGNVVLSASPTLSGTTSVTALTASSTLTATGTLSLSGSTTGTHLFGTNATTGTTTIGGTSQTGAIIVGRSTVSQQTDIQAGATASGSTKTINLGTGGLSGSTTAINIGSAVAGSTTNVTANGTWTYSTPMAATNMTQSTTSTSGYLSSTDWNTFNGKAPSVTYTTNYIPYGQGTTTPALSSNLQYDPTLKNLIAPQVRASNGIVVNSQTVSANFTIASGDSAMSAGPMTVASGVTVTISSGSRWVVM